MRRFLSIALISITLTVGLFLFFNTKAEAYHIESLQAEILSLQEQRELYEPGSPEYQNFDNQVKAKQEQLRTINRNIHTSTQAERTAGKKVKDFCTWSGGMYQCFLKVINYGIDQISSLLLYITGGLLWASAQLFELAASYSVEKFAIIINSDGVTAAWTTLRDFANIFFIFILLYVAIGYILDLEIGNKDKIIAKVITIAILINFSAFFARAIIDVSNIAAYQFYNGVKQLGESTVLNEQAYSGVAGVFMAKLNLQTWFTESTTDILKTLSFGIARAVMVLVTAFVFLAAALLMLTRMVWLIFLVVLSPLAFLAYALPNLGGKFSDWWHKLLNQAFFAPIYFLLVYLSVLVMVKLPLAELVGQNGGKIALLINFTIIIGLMVASLGVAVSFGATGAKYVSNLGKKWREKAVGGITGAIGRNTLGKWSTRIRESERLKKVTAWSPGLGTVLRNVTDAGAKAKFGSEESYKQKTDRLTKVAQEEFKGKPELQARYIKSLGRSVTGDSLIQQKSFEKAKDEDKVKLITGLEKQVDKNQPEEMGKLVEKNKELTREKDQIKLFIKENSSDRSKQEEIAEKEKRLANIKKQLKENNTKIKQAPGKVKQGEKLGKFIEDMKEEMPPNKKEDLEEELKKKRNKDRIKEQIKIFEENINEFEKKHPEMTTKEMLSTFQDYRDMVKELDSLRKGQEKPPKEEKGEGDGGGGGEKPKT